MQSIRQSPFFAPILLIVYALAVIVGLVIFINSSTSITETITENDVVINFTGEQDRIAFSGECFNVSWSAENIAKIFLNDAGIVGKGTQEVCPTQSQLPTLRVELSDGEEIKITLPVTIIFSNTGFILATLSALVAIIIAGYLILAHFLGGYAGVTQSPTVRAIVRYTLVTLISLLVMWGLLDVMIRWYFSNNGTEEQKIMYIYSVEEIRALQSTLIHTPYVSYLPDPDFEGHNTLGYRGEAVQIPKPDGTFRIVTLGGSTTYSTGTSADESYPAFLQQILRDEYGYDNVEVVNAGFLGYTTWENLTTFAFRALELEPDLVMLYMGVNDLVVREQSQMDCYIGDNAMRGLNPHRGIFVERTPPYPASALYRFLAVNLGWIPNPLAIDSSFEDTRIDCEVDSPDTTLEQRLDSNIPTYFERNVFNIIALAQANDIQPVISSWVYNVDGGRPDLWRNAIAEQNGILQELAERTETPFIDLVQTFPEGNELWERDGIHMITEGTHEQASQYAKFLHEAGLIEDD